MSSSSDSSSSSTNNAGLLWKTLEICQRVIFPFLDPKSLSTFHLAILANKNSQEALDCEQALRRFGKDRLTDLCQSWNHALRVEEADHNATREDSAENNDDTSIVVTNRLRQIRGLVQRAVDFLEPRLHPQPQQATNANSKSKEISETMILWQALQWAHTNENDDNHINTDPPTTTIPLVNRLVEAPIWCGQLQVLLWVPRGHFHGFSRVSLQANVVLLSPLWNHQCHLEAWESLGQQQQQDDNTHNDNNIASSPPLPSITMIVETYNVTPTAPIGRLVGLQKCDQETLQSIALRLKDQNTVAILSPQQHQPQQHSQHIRQVSLVSRSQARQRARMPRLPYCYYARDIGNATQDQQEDDLICCWQCTDAVDDTITTTLETGIRHWKRILETREKGLGSGNEEHAAAQGTYHHHTY